MIMATKAPEAIMRDAVRWKLEVKLKTSMEKPRETMIKELTIHIKEENRMLEQAEMKRRVAHGDYVLIYNYIIFE